MGRGSSAGALLCEGRVAKRASSRGPESRRGPATKAEGRSWGGSSRGGRAEGEGRCGGGRGSRGGGAEGKGRCSGGGRGSRGGGAEGKGRCGWGGRARAKAKGGRGSRRRTEFRRTESCFGRRLERRRIGVKGEILACRRHRRRRRRWRRCRCESAAGSSESTCAAYGGWCPEAEAPESSPVR